MQPLLGLAYRSIQAFSSNILALDALEDPPYPFRVGLIPLLLLFPPN